MKLGGLPIVGMKSDSMLIHLLTEFSSQVREQSFYRFVQYYANRKAYKQHYRICNERIEVFTHAHKHWLSIQQTFSQRFYHQDTQRSRNQYCDAVYNESTPNFV